MVEWPRPSPPLPLFTQVRGRAILRRWYAGCRIAPLAGHPTMVSMRLLGSSRPTTICCTCRKLRLGGCVTSRKDANAGGGVSRSLRGRSIAEGSAVQTSMCVQAGCMASPREAALRPSWDGSSATAAIEAPLKDSKRVARDRHRNKRSFGATARSMLALGDAPRNRSFPPGTRRSARSPTRRGRFGAYPAFLLIGVAPITAPSGACATIAAPLWRSVAYAGGRVFIRRHDT
jgi:hypothetical protein